MGACLLILAITDDRMENAQRSWESLLPRRL